MDVFLVPVAADRYELYCEEPDDAPAVEVAPPTGIFRRMAHRFRLTLAEAEQERRRGGPDPAGPPPGALGRLKARIMRWVAESVAEQRLLWNLRRQREATLVYPDDLTEAHAREILRRQLNRDFERHRFWLAIDSLGLIASAILALLPGPNLIAYYFVFRLVGHYLSVRGARQGLVNCRWMVAASAPLSALRAVVHVAPDERAAQVDAIASTLRLEYLAPFFQKTAIP